MSRRLETRSGFPWGWCVVLLAGIELLAFSARLPLTGFWWEQAISITCGLLIGIGSGHMMSSARRQEREKWDAEMRRGHATRDRVVIQLRTLNLVARDLPGVLIQDISKTLDWCVRELEGRPQSNVDKS